MKELARQGERYREAAAEAETSARRALLCVKRRKWRHAIEAAREMEAQASAALIAGRNIREIGKLATTKKEEGT